MTASLQRPLLVGGLGLTLGLLGWDSISHSISSSTDLLTVGALAAGGGYLWYSRRGNRTKTAAIPVNIDRVTIDKLLAQVDLILNQLAIETPNSSEIAPLRQQLARVTTNLTRPDRQIAITGGRRVGKSSLMKLLTTEPVPSATPLKYIETPALFTIGTEGEAAATVAENISLAADLVLFVTNGDLTATEYKYLDRLDRSRQRVILLFNQADRYLPEERNSIRHKLQSTLASTLKPADIVTASTAPTAVKVRQIQADGSTVEALEQPPVEIAALAQQLTNVLATEGEKLVLATAYRQGTKVQTAAKTLLNSARRDRALPVVEQNQWIVGAAAFANPVPALDLLATAAVNAQMVVDLGGIYQQKFTLEHAGTAAGALGEAIVKLGLVEACTQAVAAVLKTNAVTYVAGGLVQGLSAAYLTHIAGLTLIEYLEAQDLVSPEPARAWNLDLLGNTMQKVFQANQRIAYVQTVVKQGLDRLVPAGTQNNVV